MNRCSRFILLTLVGGLTLSLAACRRGDRRPVYPVSGEVFYKGKPAEGAQVTFVPRDDNDPKLPRPGAQVRKNGSFRLSTYASYDGAPAGRYAITIVYRSSARKENDENVGPDLLQGRYADPKTTPLAAEVKKETNDLTPFQIE